MIETRIQLLIQLIILSLTSERMLNLQPLKKTQLLALRLMISVVLVKMKYPRNIYYLTLVFSLLCRQLFDGDKSIFHETHNN